MTDKELLERAAKASGDRFLWQNGSVILDDGTGAHHWNPLTDDGDALRLAVKLELSLNRNTENKFVYASDEYHCHPHEVERIYENADPYAATRRCIVRAAAEIGKGLSHE